MRIILEESKIPKKKATSVMGTEEISTLKLYIKLYKLMFPLENHWEPFSEPFIRLYTRGA